MALRSCGVFDSLQADLRQQLTAVPTAGAPSRGMMLVAMGLTTQTDDFQHHP
jgi:hypothetical protein